MKGFNVSYVGIAVGNPKRQPKEFMLSCIVKPLWGSDNKQNNLVSLATLTVEK